MNFSTTSWKVLLLGGFMLASSHVAQAQQFWRTDGTSGTWVTGTNWGATALPAGGSAWVSGSNARFTADSTLTFETTTVGDLTLSDNVTVNVTTGGTLTLGGVRTFDIGEGATLNWASQGQSTAGGNEGAGIIKDGAGTLNWGAGPGTTNVRYNGGFTLNEGRVIVSGNNSFSSGVLTINGGTIQSSGTRAYANNIVIGGNFTNSGTGNATFSGTIDLGAATRMITNSLTSGSRIYSGVISGASGSGLTFTGAGVGQTYIGNAGNTFTGTISILGSEVGFASDGALGNAANTIVIDGGRLTSTSTTGSAVTSTWSSTHGIQVGDTAGTSISVQGGAGDLTYDGVISNVTGKTGSWAKQEAGILRLGGVSTYTGNTFINNGTVRLTTGNDRLPTGTVVTLGQASSSNLGTLDLNGNNQQIAGLNSTGGTNAGTNKNTVTSATAATLTVHAEADTTYTFGAGTTQNSGVIAGEISLVKSGAGTQILGDANTYTGGTEVSDGILLVNNTTGSGTGTGDVEVKNGATLGGSGTVGGDTTVKNGGTLTGGTVGGVDTLTFGENLTMEAGSLWLVDLVQNANQSSDFINVGGNLTITGSIFTASFTESYTLGNTYTIADYGGTITGVFDLGGAWNDSEQRIIGGGTYVINYGSGANSQITLTAVPEPGTFGLLGLALAGLLYRRIRNRRAKGLECGLQPE